MNPQAGGSKPRRALETEGLTLTFTGSHKRKPTRFIRWMNFVRVADCCHLKYIKMWLWLELINTRIRRCFLLNYHFVFCPKRRRKVLVSKLRDRLETLLTHKTKERGWEIIALEIMPDHIHLFIGVDPEVAPNQIMHALKGYTSRILRQEFPYLLTLPSL
jgi:putative transposase